MTLKVIPVGPSELGPVCESFWKAFNSPFQGFIRVFNPLLNSEGQCAPPFDHDTSLRASVFITAKGLSKANAEAEAAGTAPQAVWVKVVDDADPDTVMGGSMWIYWPKGPPQPPHSLGDQVAVWYPEGPLRDLATQCIRELHMPRTYLVPGPHAFLYMAFTAPEHRRKGVAKAFLEWGLARADELGLDSWVDASEMGRPQYARAGFVPWHLRTVNIPVPDEYTEEQKKQWQELADVVLPFRVTPMWRPAGGKMEGRVPPWESQAQKLN